MRKSIIILFIFSVLILNGCGNDDSSDKLKWMSKKHVTSKEMAAECMDYFANAFNEKQTDIIIFDLCKRNDENPKEVGLTRIIIASDEVKQREDFNWLYYNDPPGFYVVQ